MSNEREKLANEIDAALNRVLHSQYASTRTANERYLRQVLWDNKAGIVAHLRAGPAATQGEPTLNEEARNQPRFDNPRDPFASPDRLPHAATPAPAELSFDQVLAAFDAITQEGKRQHVIVWGAMVSIQDIYNFIRVAHRAALAAPQAQESATPASAEVTTLPMDHLTPYDHYKKMAADKKEPASPHSRPK